MKLSIIIPVFNTAEYLPACLDSVIYPELDDYEIIVVNDGSTDNSRNIAEEYISRFPGIIRLINKENGGLGDARNHGIDASSGEFLLFLDSDDKLSPNALKEIMTELETGFDMFIFDLQQININGENIGVINGSGQSGSFTLKEYPELLFQAPAACNKIIRRSLFTNSSISFPGRVWFEDLRTIPKLYPSANKIKYIDKKWYLYLMRSGSITNSKNTQKNLEIIDAVDEILNFYKGSGDYDKFRDELEYMAFYNQFLTSCTRVCLAEWNSPVLERLRDDFINKFPNYSRNPYVRSMPKKYKLLDKFIRYKMWLPLYFTMKANSLAKNKKV